MLKNEEKVDELSLPEDVRGRHTSNIANNSENTEEENVNIPATSDTGHASSESASSRKLKTTVVASTPESGIADAFHYLIIDGEILQTIINVVGKCPNCDKKDMFFKTKFVRKKVLQIVSR